MNININIYPVLATWKRNKKTGLCPLHLSVDVDNKRVAFPSLKRKLLPEQWDQENRMVRKGVPNADLINKAIEKKIASLDAEYLKKQLLDMKLTRQVIKDIAKGTTDGNDFYRFCELEISARRYKKSTAGLYRGEISKMKKYAPVVTFRDIDLEFIRGYERYMLEKLGNANNTVWKSTKFLNTFLNFAVGKHIAANPLKDHQRARYRQQIPDYLEWNEVQAIKDVLIRNITISESVRTYGYCFFLSCNSGLRFSDVTCFDYEKFVREDSTGRRLILRTEKTGEIVSIAFTKDIAFAVDYLQSKSISVSNQVYNRELKQIAAAAGIRKLKSHMGRHSFAMRCAELGMREEDVMKLMGHSSIDYTRIYYRIKNKRLDQAMSAFDQDEEKKKDPPNEESKSA
jgi:integrase/recombinase XerD